MTRRKNAPPRTRGPKAETVALRPRDATGHFAKPKTDWALPWLAAYANSGNIRASCLVAQVDRRTVDNRRAEDPEFVTAFHLAEAQALDVLAAEARRRALANSDTLLIYMLKIKGGPDWRQDGRSQVEVSGPGGGPQQHDVRVATIDVTDEMLTRVLGTLQDAGVLADVIPLPHHGNGASPPVMDGGEPS